MSKPDLASLEKTIEKAFEERDAISTATRGETRDAIQSALDLLDRGAVRVAFLEGLL
ncbi:2,3,4,5-tetrahydropyridine-2,6-dicarboxylate N-succinyltransferase, partial [Mesorhizobium sp. M7A.T.Ca.TU.009.01.3.2]